MRLALISRRFDPEGGGTERDLLVTARILAEAGHEVTLYADEVRGHAAEFAVHRVPTPRLGRALRLYWFATSAARVARGGGADLVLSFARIADADILRSGGSAHSSYLRAARGWRSGAGALAMRLSPYHRAQIAIESRGFACLRLKRAIAVSNLVREDLIRAFRLDPARVVTIYNGVDLQRFRPCADAATRAIRREFGVPDDAPAVAFIGNGFARKGLRFLLQAWPAIASKPHLMVVGVDRAIASYQRLAHHIGVGERVHFIGAQSGVERIFAGVDALALPSLFEAFGNVAMEAMASGLPVLVSAACGAAETLPMEMREFVVADPANVGEIAARMNALLEARKDLSAVARATAEQFTWERYGRQLMELLASL
jgi:UDP-glucose:(heptosyl)LPS alpha-1,3-glucosyltransferase